jgi:hypothetical protein
MAEDIEQKVVISTTIDNSGLVAGAQEANDALNGIGNGGSFKTGETAVKSFKQQLKEAKNEALALSQAGEANSEAYRNAARTIANLTDQQQQLTRATLAYDPGNKFQALSKVASLAANSLGALQGTFTLLGVSAETANESIAKLQSIQAIIGLVDSFGDAQDILQPFIASLFKVGTATTAATASSVASTTALGAQTVATGGAAVATNALGLSLKALGIGLIVASIAYLVANFDDLKKSFDGFLPSGEKTGEVFNKVKEVVVGLGSSVVGFLIAPIKAFISLINGDFTGALNDIKNGMNVVKNYEQGAQLERQNIRDNAAKDELTKLVAHNQEKIKHLKELGQHTTALERKTFTDRKILAKGNQEEIEKVESEKLTFENGIRKKRIDAQVEHVKKEADLRKQLLAEAEKNNQEALKVIEKGYLTERQTAEIAINESYKSKLVTTKKAYGANSQQVKTLLDAQATELGEVKVKYDNLLQDAFDEQNDKALNSYDLRIKQLQEKFFELKKNNPEQAGAINEFVSTETKNIRREETLHRNVINSETDVVNSNFLDAESQRKADLKLLSDQYAEELALKQYSDEEKLLAQAKFQEQVYQINQEYNERDKDLKQSQGDAEQQLQDLKFEIADAGIGILSGLFGKHKAIADALFLIQKGMAIGEIVVNSSKAIAAASANLAATPAVIGVIPNPMYAVQAAATIKSIATTKLSAAVGIAQIVGSSVSKFMGGAGASVNGGNESSGGINYNAAPVINSTTRDVPIQDVRITNNEPIVAYVTEKQLKTSRDKEAFYANLTDV